MLQEFLRNMFTFPNADAFEVLTYVFNGIANQFDKFFAILPILAISFGALSTVVGLGVSVVKNVRKKSDWGGLIKTKNSGFKHSR